MFERYPLQDNAFVAGMLEILYPRTCLHCHRRITTQAVPLCSSCHQQLERASSADIRARLDRLPAADGLFTESFCLWTFDDGTILRSVQHAFKYQNLPTVGRLLGKLIGEGYRESINHLPDIIIPIPLHPRRKLSRGYNQSLELCRGISSVLNIPISTDLKRRESTQSQTKLSRKERWQNVRSAFEIARSDAVHARHVLLVDDVLTTGSTLASAAQVIAPHASGISLATLGIARA